MLLPTVSLQHVSEVVKYSKTSSRTCGDQSHNSVENGWKSLQREFTTVGSDLRKSLLWSSLTGAEDGLHVLHAYTFDLWHKERHKHDHNSAAHSVEEQCAPDE